MALFRLLGSKLEQFEANRTLPVAPVLDTGQYPALCNINAHADQLTNQQRVFRTSKPVASGVPLAFFIVSLTAIAAVWWWLARPIALGHFSSDPAIKLDCVSYAPFRDDQTPFDHGLIIKPEQIEQDLARLARISGCVRIYSVDNGLDKVPELAAKAGLKVILGVWIGRDRRKNAELVDTAILLTKNIPM